MTVAVFHHSAADEEQLGNELAKFAGKWVAVREHEVIDHADTLGDLIAAARENGNLDSKPSVFRVANEPNAVCFF